VICFFCLKAIKGSELARRVEWRKMWDADAGSSVVGVYGDIQGADGKLKDARGPLTRVSHNKCYYASKSREQILTAKRDDPSVQPREPSDWRPQEAVDVEDLTGHDGNGNR
jgi:hypothetical protein